MHKFGFISSVKATIAGKKFTWWVKKNHPNDYQWFMRHYDELFDQYAILLTKLNEFLPPANEKEACGRFTNLKLWETYYSWQRRGNGSVHELLASGLNALYNS